MSGKMRRRRGWLAGWTRRGRLTLTDVDQRMALLTPTLSLDALADSDLVIEAPNATRLMG